MHIPLLRSTLVAMFAVSLLSSLPGAYRMASRYTVRPEKSAQSQIDDVVVSSKLTIKSARNKVTYNDMEAMALLPHVKEMPRTNSREARSIPDKDDKWYNARWLHYHAEDEFISASGFGLVRMISFADENGKLIIHPEIQRIELVSLLKSSEPEVYVADKMMTPRIAKFAKRRPLDDFEAAALESLHYGKDLMYSPVEPNRMFGSLRANKSCLNCHQDKREGDLLGAFTYWLKRPVDQIKDR